MDVQRETNYRRRGLTWAYYQSYGIAFSKCSVYCPQIHVTISQRVESFASVLARGGSTFCSVGRNSNWAKGRLSVLTVLKSLHVER